MLVAPRVSGNFPCSPWNSIGREVSISVNLRANSIIACNSFWLFCTWNCTKAFLTSSISPVACHSFFPVSTHLPSTGCTPGPIITFAPLESPALSIIARQAAVMTLCCHCSILGIPIPQGEPDTVVHWKKSYGNSPESNGFSITFIGLSLTKTIQALIEGKSL